MKNSTLTHRQRIKLTAVKVREDMCRCLNITATEYTMMHYEMAYEWLQERGLYKETARYYVLSPTFHRWWEQMVVQFEMGVLYKLGNIGKQWCRIPMDAYKTAVMQLDIIPADPLLQQIVKEGREAIMNDAGLKKVKLW